MADITTSRLFTDGEKGITAAKLNDIVAGSAIQPAFVSSKPVASSAAPTDNMLLLRAAGTYAQVPFQTVIDSVSAGLPSSDSEIWSVRLRSFNAIGNPNFEVDQRNAGTALSPAGSNIFICDRWRDFKTGTMAISTVNEASSILVPGTSFALSSKQERISLSTQQTSLGTSDYLTFVQYIEGPQWREISNDVTSLSLMVYSSVANLKFSVVLQSPDSTKSLCKLCTIPTANVWTLIQLPNLPKPTSGNFSILPGVQGYGLWVTLAAGPNLIAPAADTWQNGNFLGAPGMSNWCASPTSSNFILGFVQHEPGPVCSTLMDKPFSQNLDECLRYYEKTYAYGTLPGTVTTIGARGGSAIAAQNLYVPVSYKKVMAKIPTITAYGPTAGTAGFIYDAVAATTRGVLSILGGGDNGFGGFQLSTQNAAATVYQFHYTADTGM